MATSLFCNSMIYSNGRFLHGAFTVEDGRFSNVFDEPFPDVSDAVTSYDMKQMFVLPGFNDSHMHLLNYGHSMQGVLLAEHTDSLSRMLEHIREHLKDHPVRDNQWLLGRGWNQDYFTDTDRMPDRHDLDSISVEIPIMITRTCGHCAVLNSKALSLCNITNGTLSPEGGEIEKKDGEPTGRLFENAITMATDSIPSPDINDLKEMLETASRACNAYGITSVQSDDLLTFTDVDPFVVIEAIKELISEDRLSVRINEQCNFPGLKELEDFVDKDGFEIRFGDMYKSGPLKLLGDGSLGSRTAKLSVCYNGTDETGMLIYTDEELRDMICLAASKGVGSVVHAIGDGCLDQVLEAFEYANSMYAGKRRNAIVHCQLSRADQLQRIADLGIDVLAQSIFLDYDNHIIYRLVPKELADTSYNWKTLMDKGVHVSNGSDCPVELPDVLKGMQCAVTRTSMDGTGPYLLDQAFTVKEAIESFTTESAYASGEEDIKGQIKEGMLADFTVLESDPFGTDPYSISKIKVRETWLGGKRVF